MSRPLPKLRRWIDPRDFRDLRWELRLSRREASKALDVTPRTIQNWETGGARIPWMAYRLLRIQRGHALPGKEWEGWIVRGDTLHAPNGHHFTGSELQYLENVFAMARLWRQMYTRKAAKEVANKVVPFPVLAQMSAEVQEAQQTHLKLIGGIQR